MDVAGPQPGDDGFKDWPAMYGGMGKAEDAIMARLERRDPAPHIHEYQIIAVLKVEAERLANKLKDHVEQTGSFPLFRAEIIDRLDEIKRLAMTLITDGPLPHQ